MELHELKMLRYLFLAMTLTLAGCGGGAATPSTLPPVTVALNQRSASIAAGTTKQFVAIVQGAADTTVAWSVDAISGGNSGEGTISAGGLYTAPSQAGNHTVAATSVADTTKSATAVVTVLVTVASPAVLTYHNDDARDGANLSETSLTLSNVNSSQFGKLYAYAVDGQLYAQPLYLPLLNIGGVQHNVVFVATENNSVYAFDADGLQTTPLWKKNLGSPVPKNDAEGVSPQLGITSTPVIDATTKTLYVVSETTDGPFHLHALDVSSGADKFGGPVVITGTVAGTGWDSSGGTIGLESSCYQRMGLALGPISNMIYIAFGHCAHGWVIAYDKTTLLQTEIFNDTPDGAGGGLWDGGGAPAIDDKTGDLFLLTGVDTNDPSSGYNDSFVRLSPSDLSVSDYFKPDDESFLRANDADLGSGALILMPDNPSGTPHETIGGGKDGKIFVVNRDNMGAFFPTVNNVIQTVQTGVQEFDNIFSTPVYWNGFLYYHCEGDVVRAFSWTSGILSAQPVSMGTAIYGMHGATGSLSANGNTNGILWEIENTNYDSNGPAVLHAYDATNVARELYNSSQAGSRDTAGSALKFTVPTITGGKVFVGTFDELDIYGLLLH